MKILLKSHLRHKNLVNKIYHVDLIELKSDMDERFLVNYSYGTGSTLRESSKTAQPVDYEQAELIFKSIIISQINKDYFVETGFNPLQISSSSSGNSSKRELSLDHSEQLHNVYQEFLELVHQADAQNYNRCNRLIWRLGELRDKQVVPDLIAAIEPQENSKEQWLRNYSIAWALGRCAEPTATAALQQLANNATANHNVRRMSFHALYAVKQEPERSKWLNNIRNELPKSLCDILDSFSSNPNNATNAQDGTNNNFHNDLANWLIDLSSKTKGQYEQSPALRLTQVYLLAKEDAAIRDSVIDLCRNVDFQYGSFWILRLLFKIAEYEQDAKIFAQLAFRIEDTRATSKDHTRRFELNTYSQNTRNYLRRRSARLLRKTAEAWDPAYTNLAVELLSMYRDDHSDAQPSSAVCYSYSETSLVTDLQKFPGFSTHLALNQTLYRNSKRFELTSSHNRWQQIDPIDIAETTRIEAYPHLWDKQPQALIRCLITSMYEPVHNFALLALIGKIEFCRQVEAEDFALLFCSSYQQTYNFAQQQLELNHQQSLSTSDFISTLFEAKLEVARSHAQKLLRKLSPQQLLSNSGWHLSLLTSNYTDNHEFSRIFEYLYFNQPNTQQQLLNLIISYSLSREPENLPIKEIWTECERAITTFLTDACQNIDFTMIETLLTHSLVTVQKLGAVILSEQNHNPEDIPEHIFERIIESEDAGVRSVGVRLLNGFTDEQLAEMPHLLASLLLSPEAAIREEARPLIKRATSHVYSRDQDKTGADKNTDSSEFPEKILQELLPPSFQAEKAEGIHESLVLCITEDLQPAWPEIEKNMLWRLLQAQSKAAQRIGATILPSRPTTDYSVRQWAQLGKNPSRVVREWVWQAYKENKTWIRSQFPSALRIFDTDWDDSREFALDHFRNSYSEQEWSAENLIMLCDSVREDVQHLGRELLRQYFETDHGEHYLLRLSQHPARNVQLFATEFLQTYAGGNPSIIANLKPYFVTVLSAINQGRIAKERIIDFLLAEAAKDEQVAEQVGDIFENQSVTIAIQDKSRFINGMLALQRQYPSLNLPLHFEPPVIRGFVPVQQEVS